MPHKPFHRHVRHPKPYYFEVYNLNHDLLFKTQISALCVKAAMHELIKECLEKTGRELCCYTARDANGDIVEKKEQPEPLKEFSFTVYPPDGTIRPLGFLKIQARYVEGAVHQFMEKTGQQGANYQVHDERGTVLGADFSFAEEHKFNGRTYPPSLYQELAEAKISQMLGENKKAEQTQEIDEEESLE